jgi:hypothetical protein
VSSQLLEFFERQVVVMRLAIARGSAMNDHAVAAFAAIPLSEAKRWTAPPVDAFVMRGQGQRDIAATRGFGLTRDVPGGDLPVIQLRPRERPLMVWGQRPERLRNPHTPPRRSRRCSRGYYRDRLEARRANKVRSCGRRPASVRMPRASERRRRSDARPIDLARRATTPVDSPVRINSLNVTSDP